MKTLSKFKINVIILSSGGVLSQLILFSFTPVLTRIYDPNSFGHYSMVIIIASLLVIPSTLRYEHSLMLASSKKELDNIAFSIVILSIVFFIGMCLFLMLYYTLGLASNFNINMAVIPILVLVISLSTVLYYYLNKIDRYNILAYAKIIRVLSQVLSQIVFYWVQENTIDGLLLGYIVGESIYLIFLFSNIDRKKQSFKSNFPTIKNIKNTFAKFKQFPLYDVPSTVANTLAHMLPVLLIGINWGAEEAGFYALTQRVLSAPTFFIGSGFLDVFKNKLANLKGRGLEIKRIYVKTLLILTVIAISMILLLLSNGSSIMVFLFGEEWQRSGKIIEILVFLSAIRLVASPSVYIFYLNGKQKINLYFNVVFLVIFIICYLLGFYRQDYFTFLYSYVFSSFLMYFSYIFYTYKSVGEIKYA